MQYRIYPSLLDQWGRVLAAQSDYTRERAEADLLRTVNRIPFDSEAADRGTALNAAIDYLVHGRCRETGSQVTVRDQPAAGIVSVKIAQREVSPERTFYFARPWLASHARYFAGARSQVYTSAPIHTAYGHVELYGLADEVIDDIVYDIKATAHYHEGKYAGGWQKHVYPYCLVTSGMLPRVYGFEYSAFALIGGTRKAPVISGTLHPERYLYDHARTTELLTGHLETFIKWLEAHREAITDKRIFAQ